MWRAWGAVATAIASFAASLYLISVCPWPLLPFAWALSGTALTGVSDARACLPAGLPRRRHAAAAPSTRCASHA